VGRALAGARGGLRPLQRPAGLFTINLTMLATFWTWGLLNPGCSAAASSPTG
jgi:hypothetical protein